jgi:hypothetical protein
VESSGKPPFEISLTENEKKTADILIEATFTP